MRKVGIVLASHVPELASGVAKLLRESATVVPITYAGGTDDGEIGSSMEKITDAIKCNDGEELLAFYDLGSAKMTLEMAIETSERDIQLMNVSFVEGAYTAASLAQGDSSLEDILEQLAPMQIK